jgi:undecaprenyl diphosphate synthase
MPKPEPDTSKCVPQHVAIIMDGNGRWAAQRGLPRTAGHKQGIEAVRRAVKSSIDIGVKFLTIYSFSTENWSRPKTEVSFLMELMRRFIRQDVSELHKSGVKFVIIGERESIDAPTLALLEDAEKLTQSNSALFLQVAFNYGSRQEIARVARIIAGKVAAGEFSASAVTVDLFNAHLDTRHAPDPDLLIRTGGDMRISNFLLWQCAYTEFVFVPESWPEFSHDIMVRCIDEFRSRERRFGGLKAQTG